METRVLRYFLKVAALNNITKAAAELHVTQPTLSRQIMDLETELGVPLFDRHNHHMRLNRAGALFQQRAANILSLIDHTENELQQTGNDLTGTINLGCVESSVAPFMMKLLAQFQRQHPQVTFNLFAGDGDTLRERLDQGLCDLTVLIEPVEAVKYNYIALPVKEQWGVIMRADDPLAQRQSLRAEDISGLPVVSGRRSVVNDSVTNDIHLQPGKFNLKVTTNLPHNTKELIKHEHYYSLGIYGIYRDFNDDELTFVPLTGVQATSHLLTWRKNVSLSPVSEAFLDFIKNQLTKSKQ